MTLALRRRKEYESYESPPQRWFGRYDRQAQSTTAASQPRSQPRHDVRPSARRSLEQDFTRSNMTDWDQAPRFTHTTSRVMKVIAESTPFRAKSTTCGGIRMEDKFQMDVMLLRMVTKAMSQAHGAERQLEIFAKMITAM